MARSINGWLKAYRQAWGKDLGGNVYLWGLWNALLQMATWAPSKVLWEGKQRELPAGCVVFGISEIAERWNCSNSVIKKWLKYLHETGRIVFESCPRGSLVTICNWAQYQKIEEEPCPQRGDNESATSPQRDHSELLIKKSTIKKLRINTALARAIEDVYRSIYPLKKGKSRGLKILARQIKTEQDVEDLKTAIQRYAQSDEVSRGFTKHFSTFAGEWRDWLDPDAGQNTSASINVTPIDLGAL